MWWWSRHLSNSEDDGYGGGARSLPLEARVFPSTKTRKQVQGFSSQRAKAAQDILHRKKHTEAIYTKPGKPSDSRMYKRRLGTLASRFVDVLSNARPPEPQSPQSHPKPSSGVFGLLGLECLVALLRRERGVQLPCTLDIHAGIC